MFFFFSSCSFLLLLISLTCLSSSSCSLHSSSLVVLRQNPRILKNSQEFPRIFVLVSLLASNLPTKKNTSTEDSLWDWCLQEFSGIHSQEFLFFSLYYLPNLHWVFSLCLFPPQPPTNQNTSKRQLLNDWSFLYTSHWVSLAIWTQEFSGIHSREFLFVSLCLLPSQPPTKQNTQEFSGIPKKYCPLL